MNINGPIILPRIAILRPESSLQALLPPLSLALLLLQTARMRPSSHGFAHILLREHAGAITVALVYLVLLALVRIVQSSTINALCPSNPSCDIWSTTTTGLYAVLRVSEVVYLLLFARWGVMQTGDFKYYASWPIRFMLSPGFVLASGGFPMGA